MLLSLAMDLAFAEGFSNSNNSSDEDEEIYGEVLDSLYKQWLLVQLTHNVSAAATNSFWRIAFEFIPTLCRIREQRNIKKKVPGYIHIRRNLYDDICQKVHMKFAFLNKSNNSIEVVECDKAPDKRYPRSRYIKLYEEAHVKVMPFLFSY